ncbi:hypothetical protein JAAARDRAFT_34151 [Jaapia argillacea MUCL 33604]|uniref:Uncharacterized protein n=1 Tax=Jaapia argillacea MUCL 33604 TaxID=933084 RepID=A0A067Q4C7_9AGAM|nr:hypothetical protein JAAARDRAFT_34151 [Jaapia argillacea MUCL 33604]
MFRAPAPEVVPSYSSDFTSALPGGAVTPKHSSSDADHRRRQTLLSLLDALGELAKEQNLRDPDNRRAPSIDEGRDVPIVDEDQVVGADSFYKFQRRVLSLDKELRNFANAARQLGSSVGILSSIYHLRERLTQILFLFRENAASLFPRKVKREPREALVVPLLHQTKKKAKRRPSHVPRPVVFEDLDPEHFPLQIENLAKDVMSFLRSLNEFPEFQDEAVNVSIIAFEGDLKYRASCLKAYEGQFRYPAVQRYLHDLSSEMGEQIDSITSNLGLFIDIGVPTIRFAQKHAANNLLNLSTVATFFSAVTATTLQYSFNVTGNVLADSVNAFWFTSMVFSIGAAVNSLVGVTWKQAMYRSPGNRVPWWVLIWIKRSPLVFLVISVACFSIGLVLFAYSSNQNRVVCTITTVFTAFSSFGLAAVSLWVASERYIFTRHKGKKWLGDVLAELKREFLHYSGIKWMKKTSPTVAQSIVRTTTTPIRRASATFARVGSLAMGILTSETLVEDGLDPAPPFPPSPEPMTPVMTSRFADAQAQTSPREPKSFHSAVTRILAEKKVSQDGGLSERNTKDKGKEKEAELHAEQLSSNKEDNPSPMNSFNGAAPVSPKDRFASAVRSVMKLRSTAVAVGAFGGTGPRRQRTMSSSADGSTVPEAFSAIRRVAALSQRLRSLQPTQEWQPHQALVRHLQFSPNGKFLATSSWDRTCQIFRVGDQLAAHRTLAHPQGFIGQVAWSPSGNLLLTKLGRAVKVWTEDGVCRKTIDRKHDIHSIAWFPGGEAFLSVEGSNVIKMDLNGKVLAMHVFNQMHLHDVSVTPDGRRILTVGTLICSADGLKPTRSRAEKRIIVYNLDKQDVEYQVPVLHEVRDITLARHGRLALVSHENKAPPQLWRLETIRDRQSDSNVVRIQLQRTYIPKMTVDFAGPSYFGGKDDQLVLCAGKAGDIHIWDRESGELLHYFRAHGSGGDLTCIAWNQGLDTFMFATGTHDGLVKIWTPQTQPNFVRPGSEPLHGQPPPHPNRSQSQTSTVGGPGLHRNNSSTYNYYAYAPSGTGTGTNMSSDSLFGLGDFDGGMGIGVRTDSPSPVMCDDLEEEDEDRQSQVGSGGVGSVEGDDGPVPLGGKGKDRDRDKDKKAVSFLTPQQHAPQLS